MRQTRTSQSTPKAYAMRNLQGISLLVVAILAVLVVSGCKNSSAQRPVNWSAAKTGVLIVKVVPDSPGARLGLVRGDVIVGYDGIPVMDFDQLGRLQDRADLRVLPGTVELVLFHNTLPIPVRLQVPRGKLGITTEDWTMARAYVYDALINRENQQEAEKLVAEAEASHDYSRRQLLHMKVMVIPNGNSPEDEERRTRMTDSLIQRYGIDDIALMASWELLHEKRYRAAVPIFKRVLALHPDNADAILNLASAYAHSGRYDEAEELLDTPAASAESLSEYGQGVRYSIETNILLGRRQIEAAIPRLRNQAHDLDLYTNFEYLFAVAETGEIDRYRAALAEISQWDQHLVIAAPYHIDLLAAHALKLGGKKNEASMLVRRWSNNADARLYIPKFWASIPNGGDVIDTWNRFRDPAGAQ